MKAKYECCYCGQTIDDCDVCGDSFRKGQKIICSPEGHLCSLSCSERDNYTDSKVKRVN